MRRVAAICVLVVLTACAPSTMPKPPVVRSALEGSAPAPSLLAIRPLGAIGTRGTETGAFLEPMGLDLGPDGTLYIADSGNHRIQALASDGTFQSYGRFGFRSGEFDTPIDVAVSFLQRPILYVAEEGNRRVQALDVWNGRYHIVVEETPETPFEPGGVAIGRRRELYVTNRRTHELWKATSQDAVEWKRGGFGWGAEQFQRPGDVLFDPEGRLFVADTGNARVQVLDYAGNAVATWDAEGSLRAPRGLARDSFDRLYVADAERGEVFVFDPKGRRLAAFGGGVLVEPVGVTVSREGVVYVSDRARHVIERFQVVSGRIPKGSESLNE